MSQQSRLIFVWILLLGLALPAGATPPHAQRKCSTVGELTDAEELPARIHLGIRREEAGRLYEEARGQWKAQWKETELKSVLDDLAAGKTKKFSEDERRSLKALRKLADQIRTVFMLLDESHQPPKVWRKFTRDFGRLNDALELAMSKGFDKKNTEKIQEQAKALRKMLREESLKDEIAKFKAADQVSTRTYLTSIVEDMREWIEQDVLSDEQYHDLRKSVRMVAKLCRLRELDGAGADMSRAAEALLALSTHMGDMRSATGQSGEHDVPVTPEVRRLVLATLDRIDHE